MDAHLSIEIFSLLASGLPHPHMYRESMQSRESHWRGRQVLFVPECTSANGYTGLVEYLVASFFRSYASSTPSQKPSALRVIGSSGTSSPSMTTNSSSAPASGIVSVQSDSRVQDSSGIDPTSSKATPSASTSSASSVFAGTVTSAQSDSQDSSGIDPTLLAGTFYPSTTTTAPATPASFDLQVDSGLERTNLEHFVRDKSSEFGIESDCLFRPGQYYMAITAISKTKFEIHLNSLYLLSKSAVDSFLSEKQTHQESLKTFLNEKRSDLLEDTAADLIKWFNAKSGTGFAGVQVDHNNKILAKEILIMHHLGKLFAIKRFFLTHEMGHGYDHRHSGTSKGHFDRTKFSFIKDNQFSELRADLTAARELNEHDLGELFFTWSSCIVGHQDENSSHPTHTNRAKAFHTDLEI